MSISVRGGSIMAEMPAENPKPGGASLSGLTKRSFSLAGHRTSVALEEAFWDVLRDAARAQGVTLSALVAAADAGRDGSIPLASSLRLLALNHALERSAEAAGGVRDAATAAGPGHG